MKPDCPNCQNGDCKHLTEGKGSHFAVIDEVDFSKMTPMRIFLGEEAYNHLMEELDKLPAPSEALKRLAKDTDGK